MSGLRTERRRLGQNDPGRYEIDILVGPCTLSEAQTLTEEIGAIIGGRLGAVVSLTTWSDEAGARWKTEHEQ